MDWIAQPLAHRPWDCPYNPPRDLQHEDRKVAWQASVKFCIKEQHCARHCVRHRPCMIQWYEERSARLGNG